MRKGTNGKAFNLDQVLKKIPFVARFDDKAGQFSSFGFSVANTNHEVWKLCVNCLIKCFRVPLMIQ